jgi:hypothetical protein
VWIVQLSNGTRIGCLELERRVQKIFDLQLLIGNRGPNPIRLQKADADRSCVVPHAAEFWESDSECRRVDSRVGVPLLSRPLSGG